LDSRRESEPQDRTSGRFLQKPPLGPAVPRTPTLSSTAVLRYVETTRLTPVTSYDAGAGRPRKPCRTNRNPGHAVGRGHRAPGPTPIRRAAVAHHADGFYGHHTANACQDLVVEAGCVFCDIDGSALLKISILRRDLARSADRSRPRKPVAGRQRFPAGRVSRPSTRTRP